MTITVEKTQGLCLLLAAATPTPLSKARDVGGYYKIRSYQGGGEFFQHDNAQLILQYLGDFLPRATERTTSNGRTEVLYEHRIAGNDVCHVTVPLDSGIEIPTSEIERLQDAIRTLKAKETDANTDANKRSVIAAFRLPDPRKDPELYRLYGPSGSRRLLVLWGVEKETGSSLKPQDAVLQVPQHAKSGSWKWLFWALLALLILLLLWFFFAKRNDPAPAIYQSPSNSAPDDNAGGTNSQPAKTNSSPSSPQSATPIPGETTSNSSPLPATSTNPGTVGNSPPDASGINSSIGNGKPTSDVSPPGTAGPTSKLNGFAPTSGSTSSNSNGTDSTPAMQPKTNFETSSPKKASSDPKTTPPDASTPPASQDGTPKPANPTMPKSDGAPAPAPDGIKPPITPFPPLSGSTPENKPGLPPSGPNQPPTKSADPAMPKSDRASTPTTEGSKPPTQSSPPPSRSSPENKPGLPPPDLNQPYIEIIANRTSSTPSKGLVEVDLQAVLHTTDGRVQPLDKVTGWQVDSKSQNGTAGTPITSTTASVRLGEGQHQVQVSAALPNGQVITGEADVTANIKRTESTDVKVKPKTVPPRSPR